MIQFNHDGPLYISQKGGGYSDIFIKNVGLVHFAGKNLNFTLRGGGGGQKNKYFFFLGGGDEDFGNILGGHHKTGLFLGVISMHFRVFS